MKAMVGYHACPARVKAEEEYHVFISSRRSLALWNLTLK